MPHLDLSDDYKPYYELHDYTDPWTSPETVLFVHGFTENTQAWRAWIPAMARRYRLLMFDIRGFGQTAAVDESFNYTTDLFADDMVRLINHVAKGPVHVVSGKSGAISAMRLAVQRPDLVRSLSLTCPPLAAPGSAEWLPHMEEFGMRSWARQTMPARLGYDAPPRAMDWWVDLMGATSLSTAKAYLRWVVTTDPMADFKRVTVPTFVLLASPTEQTNAAAGQVSPDAVAQARPDALVRVMETDCYHPAAIDPDTCAAWVMAFLDSLPAR